MRAIFNEPETLDPVELLTPHIRNREQAGKLHEMDAEGFRKLMQQDLAGKVAVLDGAS